MIRPLATASFALLFGGCDPLANFDLEPTEAFCGHIASASRYRQGFSPRVQMRLRIDTMKIGTDDTVGTMTTFDPDAGRSARMLNGSALRPITAMSHDPLSRLEFGDGRERNMIYAVTPDNHDAESLLAVVSLRHDDRVEIRLLRPGKKLTSSGQPSGANHRPIFGLFTLTRQAGDCGF